MASIDRRRVHIDTSGHVDEPHLPIRRARRQVCPVGRTAGGPFALDLNKAFVNRPRRKRMRPVLFVASPFPFLLTEITMNTKTSSRTLHNESIQTIYPTRHPAKSRVEDEIHDRHAAGYAMPVARARIFHPFEYWAQERAGLRYGFEDLSADSCPDRAVQYRGFKLPVMTIGSLQDWATRLFHLVRGP